MSSKSEIRKMMREMERIHPDSLEESEKVLAAIESLPGFAQSSCVLAYMSIRGEVIMDGFLSRWYGKKRIVLPKVIGADLELREYSPDNLSAGAFGILEPSSEAALVDPSEIDFALIPGVAFFRDRVSGKCLRLGRGKGFYDRLLPSLNCPKASVGYSYRYLLSIPVDPWDVPLDF